VARREFNRSGDWLRRLERAGIIPPAPRDFAGYRVYTAEHVAEILAGSDCSVDASFAGLGLTGALRESLAVATPVVATAVEGNPELVIDGESPQRAPITTLRAAAELAGIEPDVGQADQFDVPAPGDLDAQLHVGEQASADLARWYAFVTEVLETLRADATESDGVSPVRIWPEHFDAAIDLGAEADGRRATYGGSPADAGHPYPYLYASPWQGRIDPFFGDPSFKGASLSHAELVAADEPHSAALAFLRRARRIVTGR